MFYLILAGAIVLLITIAIISISATSGKRQEEKTERSANRIAGRQARVQTRQENRTRRKALRKGYVEAY